MDIKRIRDDFEEERINRLMECLNERGISSHYAKNYEDAVEYILKNIPEDATIGFGGSVTVTEIGLRDALLAGNYQVFNQYEEGITRDESSKRRREGITSDFFITGTNAITEDGCIINIDGTGNRLAGIAYGGKKVFIVIGANKIVRDVDAGIYRIMMITAPMNVRRLNITEPPCYEDGYCTDCSSPKRICNQIHILERGHPKGRITVVILNESLGF